MLSACIFFITVLADDLAKNFQFKKNPSFGENIPVFIGFQYYRSKFPRHLPSYELYPEESFALLFLDFSFSPRFKHLVYKKELNEVIIEALQDCKLVIHEILNGLSIILDKLSYPAYIVILRILRRYLRVSLKSEPSVLIKYYLNHLLEAQLVFSKYPFISERIQLYRENLGKYFKMHIPPKPTNISRFQIIFTVDSWDTILEKAFKQEFSTDIPALFYSHEAPIQDVLLLLGMTERNSDNYMTIKFMENISNRLNKSDQPEIASKIRETSRTAVSDDLFFQAGFFNDGPNANASFQERLNSLAKLVSENVAVESIRSSLDQVESALSTESCSIELRTVIEDVRTLILDQPGQSLCKARKWDRGISDDTKILVATYDFYWTFGFLCLLSSFFFAFKSNIW
jgi:hypothetical protein